MKRTILISTILALSLSAASIGFNDAPVVTERTMPSNSHAILSYNEAINTAALSIVYISTKEDAPARMQQMNPFFEQFFGHGMPPRQPQPRHGLGSGVIISKDGYIATSNHVIDHADEITVSIGGDTTEYPAKVIGKDPKSDLAVIKIETKKELPAILMGHSDDLKIGDVVFAIGNPFGVGQSVTQGIISAQNKDNIGINEYENFIQTDASINPGNSGGALVDSRGALIGINSAIVTQSGGSSGIGFAIEVDMVRDITKQLIESGSISRGYIGVAIGNLNAELRKLYKNSEGAMVLEVTPGSPAEKAGLQRGDLITQIDQKNIGSASALKNSIGRYKPGSTVSVTFERDKKMQTLKVKLGDLNIEETAQRDTTLLEGLQLSNLDMKSRYNYRVNEDVQGVLITDVDVKSEAYAQNIRPGDVIMQVEKYLTPDIATLNKVLKEHKGEYKRIYINRGGRVFVTAIK
jgi:serine protease Do